MTNAPWTISKLHQFETCALQYYLEHKEKLPRGSSPAADRGTKIHEEADDFTQGKIDKLSKVLVPWTDILVAQRERIAKDEGGGEALWGYDDGWFPTDAKGPDVWVRGKLDAWFHADEQTVEVWDYKTGKQYPKHNEQMELYALFTLSRFDVERVVVKLLYIDLEYTPKPKIIDHEKASKLARRYESRAIKFVEAKEYRPHPGQQCNWCAYSFKKGGPCKDAR